jgi:hypothetical protein
MLFVLGGFCCCLMARAADEPAAQAGQSPSPDRRVDAVDAVDAAQSARPRAVPVGTSHAESAAPGPMAKGTDAEPAKYSATDKWILAGYNNNEIVYTIIVSNEDTRILHCTTLIQGWYLQNGKKLPVADRQSATVFPDQPARIGNWMDMDQQSGATYTVKCRPI